MLKEEICDFMEEQMGIYYNPHGVEIVMMPDNFICIGAGWPGSENEDEVSIELGFETEIIEEFTEAFGITSARQMHLITPSALLHLYQRGKAVISCYIDRSNLYYVLYFRKQKNKIFAKDSAGAEHEVTASPETPQQFISYTKQYFREDKTE